MKLKLITLWCTISLATACVPEPEVEQAADQEEKFKIEEFMRGSHAFVFTRDVENTTGALAIFNIDEEKFEADGLGKATWISSNIAFKSDGLLLYIIDKSGANVSIIDPESPKKPLRQFSVGAGTNPEDIALIGGKGYVTRYDSSEILVVNPDNGSQVGTIDLSEFSTAIDPYPEMSAAITAEGKVWVAVQRWDRQPYPMWWNASTEPTTGDNTGSYLVAIDPKTDTISQRVKTTGTNPGMLRLDPRNNHIFVVEAEGIESIDPKTGESDGWLVDGADFPNGIYFAAPTTDHIYVQTVDSFDWDQSWDGHVGTENSIIYQIDRKTGGKKEIVRSSEGYLALGCLELSPVGVLVVCSGPGQRVTKPGLRLFDPATGKELTKAPIKTELPPFGVAFFAKPATAVVPVEVIIHQ